MVDSAMPFGVRKSSAFPKVAKKDQERLRREFGGAATISGELAGAAELLRTPNGKPKFVAGRLLPHQ